MSYVGYDAIGVEKKRNVKIHGRGVDSLDIAILGIDTASICQRCFGRCVFSTGSQPNAISEFA